MSQISTSIVEQYQSGVDVTEDDLINLAAEFARLANGGSVITLQGQLGAGKTTFAKALAKALGVTQPVSSPTFALERQYALADGLLFRHQDWYRLASEHDVIQAGLAEGLADPRTITVIEWPERAPALVPADAFRFSIDYVNATTRRIIINSGS